MRTELVILLRANLDCEKKICDVVNIRALFITIVSMFAHQKRAKWNIIKKLFQWTI